MGSAQRVTYLVQRLHDTHRFNVNHDVMLGRVGVKALHVPKQGGVSVKEVWLASKGWHLCEGRREDIQTCTHRHTNTHKHTHTPGCWVTPM